MVNPLWGALASLLLVFSACKKGEAKEPDKPVDESPDAQVDPTLCDTKGKRVTTLDLNLDNKIDVWKLHEIREEGGARLQLLTCKQVDFNFDGRKDLVTGYGRLGNREFEKADFDWDGKFEAYYIYDKNGKKKEVHRDTDFDGEYDLKEIWTDKGLKSIRRDRNRDNEPDVWEQYTDGVLVAILYDEDFDGKVDRREDAIDVKSKPKKETPKIEKGVAPADGTKDGASEGTDKPSEGAGESEPSKPEGPS